MTVWELYEKLHEIGETHGWNCPVETYPLWAVTRVDVYEGVVCL